jgi:hypothetical protein
MSKKLISIILIIIGIANMLYPIGYWIKYPELTQMEVALNTWPFGVVSIIVAPLGFYMYLQIKLKEKNE